MTLIHTFSGGGDVDGRKAVRVNIHKAQRTCKHLGERRANGVERDNAIHISY